MERMIFSLTEEDKAEIERLRALWGCSNSEVVRKLIRLAAELPEDGAEPEVARPPIRRIPPGTGLVDAPELAPGRETAPPTQDARRSVLDSVPVKQPFNRAEYLAKMAALKARPTPPPKRR